VPSIDRQLPPNVSAEPSDQRPVNILRLQEVVARVRKSRSAILRDAAAGLFPRPIKLGRSQRSRSMGWVEAEVDRYLADRVAERDMAMVPAHQRSPSNEAVQLAALDSQSKV
jgi:prophage regulatory protein